MGTSTIGEFFVLRRQPCRPSVAFFRQFVTLDEKFWGSLTATCRCRSIALKGGCERGVVVIHVQVHGPSAEK
jgi:hypothetical protein